jgi:serine protease Do
MKKINSKNTSFLILSLLLITVGYFFYSDDIIAKFNTPSQPPLLIVTDTTRDIGSAVHVGNGYILTAYHVISNTENVSFLSVDEQQIDAQHLWSVERYDIALYYSEQTENLQSYKLDCNAPVLNQQLFFTGNPLGFRNITVEGRISGDAVSGISRNWQTVYPVQAPIIPGMSGGPAVDFHGRLRGIIVGAIIQNQMYGFTFTGLGFIVPSDVICLLMSK